MLGSQVGSWQFAMDQYEITIDVSDFAASIYIAHATGDIKIWRGKVVKQ